jgi:hypothetical protein
MNWKLKSAIGVGALLVAAQAAAQVTFYEREGFQGRSLSTDRPLRNLERQDFNEQASSAVVEAGRWQVCEDPRFEGRCVVLRPGSYESLRAMGMNNRISSVRPIESVSSYQRTFEAPITSVRAVMGPQQERCWTERQPVYQSRSDDVGDAIAGAIIGRIAGERDVQHCERVASGPQRWDVTYNFRGLERRAQLNARPSGGTLTVDENGNPIG